MATVYAVASAKGGVGKTTTTAAVATLLARSGADVVAIDADIGMANLADALGVTPDGTTIHDVLAGEAEPTAAVQPGPCGLRVVPGTTDLDAYAAADPSGLGDAVEAFADADYLFLDCGAGLSHDSTLPLGIADETLLVSTPERSALGDTEKTRQLAERIGGSVVGVAITRVESDADATDEAVSDRLDATVLARIPEDSAVKRASAAGESLVVSEPTAPATEAYRGLARALTGIDIDAPDAENEGGLDETAASTRTETEDRPADETDEDTSVTDTGPTGLESEPDESEILVADDQPADTETTEQPTDSATTDADERDTEAADADAADAVRSDADPDLDADTAGDGSEDTDDTGGADDEPFVDGIPDAEDGVDDVTDPEPDHTADLDGSSDPASGDDPAEQTDDSEARPERDRSRDDFDEELAGSVPFRDDDRSMDTVLSRTTEDDEASAEERSEDGDTAPKETNDEDDDETNGFFSRLLGR